MKTFGKIMLVILIIVGLMGLSFGLEYLGLVKWGFFSKTKKNIERQVFENTQSYVEGKRQELAKYRLEYNITKDEDTKNAIKTMLIQSFANFDKSKLDYESRTFLESLYH